MVLTGTNPVVTVVAKVSGSIENLLVSDNQFVEESDYLAIIENPVNTENILFLKDYLNELYENIDSISSLTLPPKEMKLGHLQSLYSSFCASLFDYLEFYRLGYFVQKIDVIDNRINQHTIYTENLLNQRKLVSDQLKISNKQYQRDSVLNERGVISSEQFETAQQQLLQTQISLANMNSTLDNIKMQMIELEENRLDIENQYVETKSRMRFQIQNHISQLLNEIKTWEVNYVLLTPIKGKVTFTSFWKENQNIRAGEAVFNIVPDNGGEIIGKASLPVIRSGKIKVGQRANIRFISFPDNEYGIVKGKVKNISLVPLKETNLVNYIVEIQLPEGLNTTYKKELPFYPEMEARIDIITEDISLLERFFMPLKKVLNEGFEN